MLTSEPRLHNTPPSSPSVLPSICFTLEPTPVQSAVGDTDTLINPQTLNLQGSWQTWQYGRHPLSFLNTALWPSLKSHSCTDCASCTRPPGAGVLLGQTRLLSLYRHLLLTTPMQTCKSPTQQRGHHQPGSLAPIPSMHAVSLRAPAFPPLPQTLFLLSQLHSTMLQLGTVWEE